MISIDKRKKGPTWYSRTKRLAIHAVKFLLPPTQLIPRPKSYSPVKTIRKKGVYAALKENFEEEEQAKATEESPQIIQIISQNKSTSESLEEIPAESLKIKSPTVEEEIDNGIIQNLTVGFTKFNLEHPPKCQAKFPAQIQNILPSITGATSNMESPDQDIMTGSKVESRLDPESKSDTSVWPKSAQCKGEDISRDKDVTERHNRLQETAESLDKEIGVSDRKFECSQYSGHSFKDCWQNRKTEKLPVYFRRISAPRI